VTGLAFISANLGALELGRHGASRGRQIRASPPLTFYWVGAIPAMIFLARFMMPFLLRLKGAFGAGVFENAFR